MVEEADAWLTLTEAARYLSVSKVTILRLRDKGELQVYHLKWSPTMIRVKKSDLDNLVERHEG